MSEGGLKGGLRERWLAPRTGGSNRVTASSPRLFLILSFIIRSIQNSPRTIWFVGNFYTDHHRNMPMVICVIRTGAVDIAPGRRLRILMEFVIISMFNALSRKDGKMCKSIGLLLMSLLLLSMQVGCGVRDMGAAPHSEWA